MTYMEYFQYDWMYIVPYTLLSITGIVFSIIFLGRKKSFAIFSLIGYILSLLFWWVINFIQFSLSKYSTLSSFVFMLLGLLADVFILVAVFDRKETQPFAASQPFAQPPYGSFSQAGVPQYPPQPPQVPPQPPQNPPLPHP